MERLLRELELVDLYVPPPANDEEDSAILVAHHVPLETWNRFAELDELPRGLRLNQLAWGDGRVWVVEFPLSVGHESALGRIQVVFAMAFGLCTSSRGRANLTGPNGLIGEQLTFAPDYAYLPLPTIPGAQVPPGGASLIVEVMRNEPWALVRPKLEMYRQLDGLQYIFCLKMSRAMQRWSYELFDVGHGDPAYPDDAEQHSFSISEADVPVSHQHFVRFDSKRVLGLPNTAQLRAEFPDQVVIDVVALAQHARMAARTAGEAVL